MNASFKEWLIRDALKWDSSEKSSFLRILKDDPEEIVRIISSNLIQWAEAFTAITGTEIISLDIELDSRELLEAYRKHFAEELERA